MLKNNIQVFTSESVGVGHPDKICDQIADKVLDSCLAQDANSRVACEVFACDHVIVIGGEITTKAYVDPTKIAWEVLLPLGYKENDFKIFSNINVQSSDIANIVHKKDNQLGAGDQGIVFGYACNETKQLMPLSIVLSHELVKRVEKLVRNKKLTGAKYDMKSQVSLHYENNQPVIDIMLMSIQHERETNLELLKQQVVEQIMLPLAKEYQLNTDFEKLVNAAGAFVIGGPIGDSGLTGRKIIVDTYGGVAHHGGGAFSGKDYSKVDRTGAYMARWVAKNVVAAKLATKCEVQLGWAIGATEPISIYIDTFGTETISKEKIHQAIQKTFNLNLSHIVDLFKLKTFKYNQLSVYGHVGREDVDCYWEQTNLVQELLKNSK